MTPRRIRAGAKLLLAASLLLPALPALAGPTTGDWEFHLFVGKATLDNSDPFALSATRMGDFNGDGTATNGTIRRAVRLNDDAMVGFRLGYMWEPRLETELSYDRNHSGSDFEQSIQDLGSGRGEIVNGKIESVFTAYQIGVLYHPLAYWRTPWQPYVTVAVGWMDVDFTPNKSLAAELRSGLPGRVFNAELPEGDQTFMVGYGLGLKYYLNETVALRADFRAKSYDLLEERRMDREISIGLSFFAPSEY